MTEFVRWRAVGAFLLVSCLVASVERADGDADGPDYFRVVGVAPPETLNVRSGPGSGHPVVGTIPPNGAGIRNLGCQGGLSFEQYQKASEAVRTAAKASRWCKVEYGGVTGWVAGSHLAEGVEASAVPGRAGVDIGAGGLPADVRASVLRTYGDPDAEPRYLDAWIDLNDDGKNEVIVHVVGPMACGTGGCPTLVFTPAATGYRLVSTTTITKPPIRASAASSHGWRNLIVHVGGGGGPSYEAELPFDGKAYPSNPTGPDPKHATLAGSQVLIPEFTFQDTKVLSPAGSGPSFACGNATSTVEKLICSDDGLAALDRTLSAAYAKAMASTDWSDEIKRTERANQRAWLTARDACGKQRDVRSCVEASYGRRLAEVQIRGGQLEAPTAVGYRCEGHESTPFFATFYDTTDPKSAVLTFGDEQVIAFAEPSGSGARYTSPQVDFWEHHGQAAVTWSGRSFTCRAL